MRATRCCGKPPSRPASCGSRPVPVAQHILAPCLPALAVAHPKLLLQIHASDRLVDIAQEGFDIAVRSHFARCPIPRS